MQQLDGIQKVLSKNQVNYAATGGDTEEIKVVASNEKSIQKISKIQGLK